ncbi:MAG: M13 family peptidase, partial [Prevotella sp.]|nr:M13 family peptidase [Prevotella sp.]
MNKLLAMIALATVSATVSAQTPLRSGIDLTDMNATVAPGTDFYEYACGGWMKKNPLPAAYSRFGSFDRLGQDN